MINEKRKKEKKGIAKFIPLILVIAAVIIGGTIWYHEYSKYIGTDDAYIDSDKVSVSSKISGRIAHLYVDEGDTVKNGQLLIELDSTELVAQRNQMVSNYKQMVTSKDQSSAKYEFDKENIKVQEINYEKTQEDLARAKKQFEGSVIPKEQYDHIRKANESAKAQLDASRAQLNVSKAQINSSEASIASAESQIKTVMAQLQNTRIYAPMDGVVAKRWLLSGDVASPGQAVVTVTNEKKLWVSVYIEETNMNKIHEGQKVLFTVDAFPKAKFSGKIYWIGSNTAAQFSLIPPSNASGNFTKVTQRVPLKISIDEIQSKEAVNLLAGMSAIVKIVKE
jgi:membrane fusion protein (multidrug efflux system)